jgi:hypothetical protein
MLVNPEVQDYLDRLQGRSRGGGLAPGRAVAATPNYAGEALGGIIRPNVSSFGFRGAIPTELTIPRFRPAPPAPSPGERGAAEQQVPGPVRGAGGSLGGEYKAAGLQKLGQGIEQMLSDLAEKRKQEQENAARANAVPALPTLQPRGGRPGAAPAVAPGAAAPPSPYPGAAPITTPAVGPAGGPNPLIGQGLGIRGSAPFSIGGGTSLPIMAQGNVSAAVTTAMLPDAVKSMVKLAASQQGMSAAAIGDYFHNGGVNLDPKTNAWCAAFVDSTLRQAGMPQLADGINRNVATNYARWGEPETPGQVQPGDIVINPQGAAVGATGGHVGIATGERTPGGGYATIAGNAPGRVVAAETFPAGSVVRAPPDAVQDFIQDNPNATPAQVAALGPTYNKDGAAPAASTVASGTGLTHPENNNPFNIKFIGQPGTIASKNTDQGDPQAVYPSYGAGVGAARDLALRKYSGGMTTAASIIADAERGWTPGNMEAAKHVADSMGVGVNDDLNLRDPAAMRSFQRALLRQEQGQGALPYFDQFASAPAPGAPSVALPPTSTAIADINKPQPTVAAAPASPQPAVVGSAGPAAAAVPLPPPRPDQQSMNVAPPSQQDLLASALAQSQPQAPPPVDPNMLAMALQGGGAPAFGGGDLGGFFG